jgi:hypothetical protein
MGERDGLSLASVEIPRPQASSPHAAEHLAGAEAVARAAGLLAHERDVARFRAFAKIDLYFFHYADLDRLSAAASYSEWMYFLDDSYDDHPGAGNEVGDVERRMRRVFEVMRTGRLAAEATPLERFTKTVHDSLRRLSPWDGWYALFLDRSRRYLFEGSLESMAFWRQGGPLTVADYAAVRSHDSGVLPVLACALLASNTRLPQLVLTHPSIVALEQHTVRHVAFLNDLFSYQKEVMRHGYPCNLVHVLSTERRVELGEAVQAAIEIVNSELRAFVAIERELPSFGGELDPAVARYVMGMKALMRGNYDFSLKSRRFRDAESPFSELRRARTISFEMPAVSAAEARRG